MLGYVPSSLTVGRRSMRGALNVDCKVPSLSKREPCDLTLSKTR